MGRAVGVGQGVHDGGRADAAPGRNEVELVGRVAAAPEERELPSGDVVVTWRLVVDRPPRARSRKADVVRVPVVDTLDCAAWEAGVRRRALRFGPGDVVSVSGALRRRFWRGPSGAQSRYEVEAVAVKRLTRTA